MRKNKTCGIYCIENTVNSKKYIGQSRNIEDRWCKHKKELNDNKHCNDYLQKAWNKYTPSLFKFYVLEECSIDALDAKEIYYIDLYKTTDRDFGYNLKSGGQDGGSQMTKEARDKLSKSLKESYNNKPELRKNASTRAFEQWSKPEIKEKILGKNNGMYGKTHTKEAREKISQAQKGRISPHRNFTPVICIELNKIFIDSVDACKKLEIKSNQILQVCYGNRHTCGGYHWKFATENNI